MDESNSPQPQRLGTSGPRDGSNHPSAVVQLFGVASPTDRCLYLVALVCSVGSGTIMPLMTLIFGNFVTVFTGFSTGIISHEEFLHELSHYTLYFLYLFIAKLGLSYISMVLFTIVSTNVTSALQQEYLHAVLKQRIAFHETELRSGVINEALSNHSNSIRSGLSDKFGMTVQNISTIVTGFVVAMTSIWNLALAVAAIIPAAVIVIAVISVFDEKMELAIRTQKEEASTLADEVFSSIRTVRSLGRGASDKLFAKYGSFLKKATELGWKRAPIYGIQIGTYMMLLYCAYALAFWYGIRLYSTGKVSQSGKVITTLFSIMIAMNSFSQLAGCAGPFVSIFTSVKVLFNIINAPVDGINAIQEIAAEKDVSIDNTTQNLFRQDIILDDVSFRYPTRPAVKILNSLSLTIPGGKSTAFVGQSGCGKSTIIGLLLRWYDVESGSITIGGVEVVNMPLHSLRSKIGFVSQEPQLFSGTILENVANGLLGSSFDGIQDPERKERVIEACKIAHAHDFITQLPEGYDTHVGDRGTQLSGGQKQRIAIARAIVKDPPILIFDEATSALDTASEAVIQKAIESASRNRTIISIAHRLRTIQKSDHIYVLGKQTIIEQGSHESLLASQDSLYKRLWKAQSLESGTETPEDHEVAEIEMLKQITTVNSAAADRQDIEAQKKTEEKKKGTWTVFFTILSDYRRFWLAYLGLVAGSIIAGALFPIQAFLYAKVVSAFQLTGNALSSAGNFWGLMWFVLALAVAIGYMALSGLGAGLGEMVSADYRGGYFRAFAHQPISFFDERANSPGSLITRLSTDPESIKEFAGGNISVLVTVGVSLISTIALALAVGWKFALVVLAGGLPFIFGASYVREMMENSFEENAGKVFNESVGYASECIQAIRTVVSLNMEPYVETRFGRLLTEHSVRARHYALKAMVWFALSESIELLAMALAFWYGGTLIVNGGYTTEQFFIVFIAIVFGSQSAGSYFAHSTDISKGVAAVNAISKIESSIKENPSNAEKWDIAARLASNEPVFELRNVDFSYPARPNKRVLKNFNILMQPGQFIAIVGESGSGKSTITGILEQFYNVNRGEVYVYGSKVESIREGDIHETFAMVSQEPVLYQGSVKENLLLGTIRDVSQEELDEVVAACQLTDLIQSLPEGYETLVGTRGTALSGGQRQRMAIARALIRNSPVLLLDEATSALDSMSEKAIHEALMARRHSHGGMLVIAHRLSTVKAADAIYVMSQGRVVEMGSHSELMSQQGKYYSMWKAMEGDAESS